MTQAIVETRDNVKITISEEEYSIFKKDFGSRKFPDQRFGQAFFNYFKLDQMDHRGRWDKLYNCEDMLATIKMIRANFEFTGATRVTTS